MFYKAVITSKGLALDAKIKAGQTTAAFTRVKLGDGTYDGQEDLKGAANLKNTRNEFGISSIKVIDENTVRIRIVTNNSSLNSGYYISELALFATDPDEGEILYSISLGVPGKMDYQPSKTEMLNATATIDILTSISDAETANIQTGTGAAASAEDLAELETRIKGVETPEFDASGSVDGITGKTTLLASFVSKMPLIKFMRNVKAGFKLVSFVGDIVNNCVTDNANLPLSAAQGKKLMDLYTVLNTKIGAKVAVVSFVKSSIPIAAGADFYAYIPIDIDITDVIWAFPVLTDAPGDNCTKVNISTCVWQDKFKRIYVNGCNLASGTANISLAGVLIAIR